MTSTSPYGELTATDTVIEAEDVDEVFGAVQAANGKLYRSSGAPKGLSLSPAVISVWLPLRTVSCSRLPPAPPMGTRGPASIPRQSLTNFDGATSHACRLAHGGPVPSAMTCYKS